MRRFMVIGMSHTDLAWRGDAEQYANYLEQFVVIMLDLLDQFPDMTYVIEQAYHYRGLKVQRPDLIERLKARIAEGRIEVMGGMASTADTNIPCAESLVRNQLLGRKWFRENLGAEISTGWLQDAFGLHAQLPQIMRSFGFRELMGSRFGGDKHSDLFIARGLDGTELLMAGRDCFSANLPGPEATRVFFDFVPEGEQVDRFFEDVRKTRLSGPVMVDVYVEDDTFPNRRMVDRARELRAELAESGDSVQFALPRDFFRELRKLDADHPVEWADLNPEFTGTFAQRIEIRLQNRRAEEMLLSAEKWRALMHKAPEPALTEAWWDLFFVHFHDVFTGSHPEKVYLDVMRRLHGAADIAEGSMRAVFGEPAAKDSREITVVNGLPFEREEYVRIPFDGSSARISGAEGIRTAFAADGTLVFRARVPACAAAEYRILETAEAPAAFMPVSGTAVLENDTLALSVDGEKGITLVHKPTGTTVLKNVRDILVLQGDTGSFQIEQIEGGELHAFAHPVHVEKTAPDTIRVCGCFGQGDRIDADWTITFTLRPGERHIGLEIGVNWQASGKRLRLKLPTSLRNCGEGIFEIPFGTVRRSPYVPDFNSKGEWPAQRFAAVENDAFGLALINCGVPGVEIPGNTIYTTLLRAPTQNYAGMEPDASSQQHGRHVFRFAVYPYPGKWQRSELVALAQRMNSPLRVYGGLRGSDSLLSIDTLAVQLYAVKSPEDPGRKGMILHLCESTGESVRCVIDIPGMTGAYDMDLKEEILGRLPADGAKLSLDLSPWQIRTVYVERSGDD